MIYVLVDDEETPTLHNPLVVSTPSFFRMEPNSWLQHATRSHVVHVMVIDLLKLILQTCIHWSFTTPIRRLLAHLESTLPNAMTVCGSLFRDPHMVISWQYQQVHQRRFGSRDTPTTVLWQLHHEKPIHSSGDHSHGNGPHPALQTVLPITLIAPERDMKYLDGHWMDRESDSKWYTIALDRQTNLF